MPCAKVLKMKWDEYIIVAHTHLNPDGFDLRLSLVFQRFLLVEPIQPILRVEGEKRRKLQILRHGAIIQRRIQQFGSLCRDGALGFKQRGQELESSRLELSSGNQVDLVIRVLSQDAVDRIQSLAIEER